MSFTNESTIALKAAPMITATAKSTTFPRIKNSLNSFNIIFPPILIIFTLNILQKIFLKCNKYDFCYISFCI